MKKRFIYILLLSILSILSDAMDIKADDIILAECDSKDSVVFKNCDSSSIKECAILTKMQEFANYLKEKEKPCSTIVSEVNKRYNTFIDTVNYKIKYRPIQWKGYNSAPIEVIMYISMSCPHCKQVYADLYDSIVNNIQLRKTMKLGIICLTNSRIDKAVMASAFLWKQPMFLRALSNIKERITEEMVEQVADSMGIDTKKLWKIADSEKLNKFLSSSRQEAKRNRVELTPTLFINGIFYRSSKDAQWIFDFVRYKAEERKKTIRSNLNSTN